MDFLVACQCALVLMTASTVAQHIVMVVSESPDHRFANEPPNRYSDLPTPLLHYTNPEGKRKRRSVQSWQEEIPAEVQRSISMTPEPLLIQRPNTSSSFDYEAKRQEITTKDTNSTKTDDRGSRFFVNQNLQRGGNEERTLTDLDKRSVHEKRKDFDTEASSMEKTAIEILNENKDEGVADNSELISGKESQQLTSELFDDTHALHQQTANSQPVRTQHLQENKRTIEEDDIPKALPLRGSNVQQQQHRHFVTPLSASSPKINSRFSRQNLIQLKAASDYQKALRFLQIGSTDFSGKTSITGLGQPPFRFNPAPINGISEVFHTIPHSKVQFRKIPSNQVAFIPPKIIYENRILPASFTTIDPEQKEFRTFPNIFRRAPDLRENIFEFTDANDQIYQNPTTIPTKDSIPVDEISSEFENEFVKPLPAPEVAPSSIINGISNHKYETARPIIESEPLNHRLNIEDVDETNDSPTAINLFENNGAIPDFSNSEDQTHNNYNRKNYPQSEGKYSFGYRVTDKEFGNDFGHEERRIDDITRGRYHVLLPDGRIQNVNYHVDHDGYHAKVTYHYDY